MRYAQEVAQYIKDKYNLDELKAEDYLFTSGVIDSFGIVELISDLENLYSIRFNSDDLKKENLETVNAIARLIETKKQ